MGKRKFRLAQRKNYERKKYQKCHESVIETCSVQSLNQSSSTNPSPSPESPERLSVSIPITSYSNGTVTSSKQLLMRLQSLKVTSNGWSLEGDSIGLGMFSVAKVFSYGTLKFTISSDCQWTAFINEHKISLPNHTLLQFSEEKVNTCDKVEKLLSNADKSCLCIGNPDEKFCEISDRKKGKFMNRCGEIIAYHDSKSLPEPSIRTSNCSMFVPSGSTNQRCATCNEYRKLLFALVSKAKTKHSVEPSSSSSHVNYRYLSTPEKVERLRQLRRKNRELQDKIHRLQVKLDKALEKKSVSLDDDISQDFQNVMEEEDNNISTKFSEDSFQAIFWKHQKESLSKEGKQKNGNRWHPLMIRWCLYLRHYSSKAYEAIRESGCIVLPSQRTLRDYSNAVKADAGFSSAVDEQLIQAAKLRTSPSYHALLIILMDEMHIREELVYSKHTGKLVGYVNLGDINNHLSRFERLLSEDDDTTTGPCLAKTMMVFMVKGIFTSLKFPYALFPCSSLVGEQLFSPFWECVFRLERMGFKVLGTTFDGASVNRRLIAIHDTTDKLVYKLQNIYADEKRFIYCFSDPPHLIKTVRNCWSSKNRFLWNNGKNISWQHLIQFYEKDNGKCSGLSMVPKLKFEHIHLTSFSKMRVDLAAQVLSESVGKAIQLSGGPEVSETSKFILIFDKFFDLLNVSHFNKYAHRRKPFQQPYHNSKDERLKWLENTFIPYLDSWEASVNARKDCDDESQKKRMLLSTETLLGLRRTAKSFVDFVKYIFSLKEVQDYKLSFLSNSICQDPLECFFGCQRQRGGTSDNPSVAEFYQNTQALRVIDSFCRGPIRGNCREAAKRQRGNEPLSTPLAKRRRLSKKKKD